LITERPILFVFRRTVVEHIRPKPRSSALGNSTRCSRRFQRI